MIKNNKNSIFKSVKNRGKLDITMVIVFVILALYAITLVFPFVWMLFNSIKTNKEFFGDIWKLPESFVYQNYTSVLFDYNIKGVSILQMFGISAIITLVGTFICVMLSASTAYVIAKYEFKGRNFLYSLAIFMMVVPVAGTLPAQYNIMQKLNLIDEMLGVLLLYAGAFGFNFFILYGFFKNLSWGYAEAGLIDGCTDFGIFFKIMLPLALPALSAIGVIHGIGLWNDYVTPSIYLKSLPTLAVGVNLLMAEMRNKSAFPEMFATMIISLVPIMVVFIAFQKTIMQNTIAGGLK